MGGLNVARHTSSRGLRLCDFNLCIQLYEATVRGHSVCALLGGHWTIVQKVCGGPSGKMNSRCPGCRGAGKPRGAAEDPPTHHSACITWPAIKAAGSRQHGASADSGILWPVRQSAKLQQAAIAAIEPTSRSCQSTSSALACNADAWSSIFFCGTVTITAGRYSAHSGLMVPARHDTQSMQGTRH